MVTVWICGSVAVEEKHIIKSLYITYSEYKNVKLQKVVDLENRQEWNISFDENGHLAEERQHFTKAIAEPNGKVFSLVEKTIYVDLPTHL